MGRSVHRWNVPIDDREHGFEVTGDPLKVAEGPRVVGRDLPHGDVARSVSFWVEWNDDRPSRTIHLRVYGTGQEVPDNARHWGTTERTPEGLVWHLYEIG